MVSSDTFYNVIIIALEFAAVVSLWVWLTRDFFKFRTQIKKVRLSINEVHVDDPNKDVLSVIAIRIRQSSTMLPMLAAFASLDVIFSNYIISYVTLFP